MEILKLNFDPFDKTVLTARPARVYVNGLRRRDLKVLTWEVLPAPQFGRVRITWHSVSSQIPPGFEDAGLLPSIGSAVWVKPALGSGETRFFGVVSRHIVGVGEQGDQLDAEVSHVLGSSLNAALSSRWQLDGDRPATIDDATVCFNADVNHYASSRVFTVNGRRARIFDTQDNTGRRWCVTDALGYLLAIGVPGNVHTPGLLELERLAGGIDLDDIDVTGQTVGQALMTIAGQAGLALRPSREGVGVVFYRPGYQGRRRRIRLQPAGSDLSLAGSNLWQGRLRVRERPSRPSVLALGDYKQYESTFPMSPGWDRSLETSRWRDFVRSKSDEWPKVADVYRKWVLNEHGSYGQAPWGLGTYNFTGISSSDFRLNVPRKFMPCLSTDQAGQSLGIVVEAHFGGEGWQRWTGPVWVSDEECAIYLGGDGLSAEYFQAAVDRAVMVRVTATVASDVRLSAIVPGDPGVVKQVFDFSDRAAWRKVHGGSVLLGEEGTGTPCERDDAAMLRSLARRHSEMSASATDADLDLGWIDTTCHVGDIIERIDGRVLELSSHRDGRPHVLSVRHDFTNTQSTRLIVSG